jgi:hypothetical protein
MRAKCLRGWVSCVAIAAIAFAQFAVALHACPVPDGESTLAEAPTPVRDDIQPCAGMSGVPHDTQGNACETHCSNGIVAPAQLDPPALAFAALPVLPLLVADPWTSLASAGSAHIAASRAPPLTLRFCRLLI